MLSKEKTAYIFLILTTLFWSGNFIVGKAASLFEIPPFTLNFYRWLFAWLILAPFTLKEILKKKNYILENIKLILILGITSITIFNSIVYYSLNFTQVISGVLMISTIPVMIIFFCWIFKIEKTNIYQITGVIFSLLGVVVIITKTAKIYYPYLPVNLLLKDKYDSINKIDKITKPLLIMHGMKDDIVPYVMSVELFNKANKPKYSFFPKDDNHMMDFNDELLDKIRLFIKQH